LEHFSLVVFADSNPWSFLRLQHSKRTTSKPIDVHDAAKLLPMRQFSASAPARVSLAPTPGSLLPTGIAVR